MFCEVLFDSFISCVDMVNIKHGTLHAEYRSQAQEASQPSRQQLDQQQSDDGLSEVSANISELDGA